MDHRFVLGKISTSDGQKSAFTLIPGRWVGKSSSVKKTINVLLLLGFNFRLQSKKPVLIFLVLRGVGNTIGCSERELDECRIGLFFIFECTSSRSTYLADSLSFRVYLIVWPTSDFYAFLW